MAGLKALWIERYWPVIAAVAATSIWWWWGEKRFPSEPANLLAATGNTVAVLVGFLAASKAIVLSISGSKVFRTLKSSGYHSFLFSYFYQAIVYGIIFLAISIFGFFVTEAGVAPEWYKIAWIFFAFLSFSSFVRVVQILFKLLRWV